MRADAGPLVEAHRPVLAVHQKAQRIRGCQARQDGARDHAPLKFPP